MTSCVPWDFEDEHGDNPTGQPGSFLFDVWYEVIYEPGVRYDSDGDGDPGYGPVIEVLGVTCNTLDIDGSGPRRPTQIENAELGEWFRSYLDSHPHEHERVEADALQYMQLGADESGNW